MGLEEGQGREGGEAGPRTGRRMARRSGRGSGRGSNPGSPTVWRITRAIMAQACGLLCLQVVAVPMLPPSFPMRRTAIIKTVRGCHFTLSDQSDAQIGPVRLCISGSVPY